MKSTSVVSFEKKHLPAYVRLNRQWIEEHFAIEPMDLFQLENPGPAILEPGGEILILLEDEGVVGTVAMVPHGPGCYELAKLAVDPEKRGSGYGSILMEAAIAWAKDRDADRILLLSNTSLKPALGLYEKHGFHTLHLGEHPDYKRCNIEMELRLKPATEQVVEVVQLR